jgi:hypothetical protein
MKKYKIDLVIIIALIVLAGISWLIIHFLYNSDGNYVEVFVNGTLQNTYSLEQNGEYEIKTENAVNVIQVKSGQVLMKDADCPDKLCIKQGKISKDGQSIICLPHKVVVYVTSKQKDEVDAYAK